MNSNESFDALYDFPMDVMELDDMSFFVGMDNAFNNQVEGMQELIQLGFENTAPSQTLAMEPQFNYLYSMGQDELVETSSNQDLQCNKIITDDKDDDTSELTMDDDSYYPALSMESEMEMQVSMFKLVQLMQRSEMSRSILSNLAVRYPNPNTASFALGVDQNRIQFFNYINTIGRDTL